jgi:23S rRNA (uracil1939-C5)-methyltransferase
VVDPPRSGLTEELAQVIGEGSARLVYVSCDPATLARDTARLINSGMELVRAQPIDLFPQTFHVETVAEFAPVD